MLKLNVKYSSVFLIISVCKRNDDYTENNILYFSLFSCNDTCRTKLRRNDTVVVNYAEVFYVILAVRSADLIRFINADFFSNEKVELLYVLSAFHSHISLHHPRESFMERIYQRVCLFVCFKPVNS